jgi:hypothetical protein
MRRSPLVGPKIPQKRKGLGSEQRPLLRTALERNLLRLSLNRRFVRHLLFLGAVELADGIRLHLPSLERHGDLALAFAELLLVGAAHQRALDVDVVAFAELRRGVFAEAVPGISYVESVFLSLSFATG